MDFTNAWINGRTLAKSLAITKASHSFGRFAATDRVKIELPRDLYALGIEQTYPAPFVIEDGLLVTVEDIDSPTEVIELANLRFTANAFKSAANDLMADDLTAKLELLGSQLSNDPEQTLQFSEMVCQWGRGQRVWGNLKRHYSSEKLGADLANWLMAARKQEHALSAISPGIAIKGLGVSFASKHLRHLAPNRFAVLDDVISQGLGYALNPAGYNLFTSDLRRLQATYLPNWRIADIEAGLFVLVRQIVRGRQEPGA